MGKGYDEPGPAGDSLAQPKGALHCRKRLLLAAFVRRGGRAPAACGDPRCSFECRALWARRQADSAVTLLRDLPPAYGVYRGNLRPPDNTDADGHRTLISGFLKALRGVREHEGPRVEVRAAAHDTGVNVRHYDFMLYSDELRRRPMRDLISGAAGQAGFSDFSCVPVPCGEVKARVEYAFKTGLRPIRGRRYAYLAAKHSPPVVWGSRGFFHSPTRPFLGPVQ